MYFISIFYKQKKYQFIFCLLGLFLIYSNSVIYGQNGEHYVLKTLVIDPGHGGKDEGAPGKHSKEKDIALSISLKLGKLIEENLPEVNLIYTRKTDVFVPLDERADIANKNKANLFISIHLNSNKNTEAYGTETYAMGLHVTNGNLEVAKIENSAILYEEDYSTKYEGFDPNSSESYIIFTFLQNTFLEQSLNYASFIQNQFETRALRKSRGVKQAGFLVLWKTTMPSVLVEAGFLSNPNEEKFLMSDEGQDYIASAIFRAFKEYKQVIEEKSQFATKIESDKLNNSVSDSTINDSIVSFKVQLSSSKNPIDINSPFFKGVSPIEELKFDDTYKYTSGSFNSYNDILEYKKQLEEKFPDAFIIAIDKSGKQIPLNEAFKILNN
ncbi:MAG: hypothetical protein A2X13_12220 [Bacteroidetes bacterium GWC2_33_15]|nr:MAG: hypothetical protein A2X10_14480 [Bacteroidetes bacterium GWA2_33_15]OFX50559.1 MAG: hypothetical protein A2X13_12220 [Bacteroidetes bacterium GWC2_33_15]OFX64096.1 MAG: hypothetical protein A2X15_02670 [Bacteroidetes bacterium GWB2_32_14]OFX69708.1 MAG: hypothetical protein A2X14_04895 [Bacteroidetes bacterium GWD2_33_33]HAN19741.1 N-acetylmuramoyl-L-alanine amidase [Bacteroidales bacterium]